jgi:sugar/nucleoside kinase (ribokinase family)
VENELSARPDYLAIGHISKDMLPGGHAPGGSALYSALTAQRLGLQAAIVTACASTDDSLLDVARDMGVWVYRVDSPATTTFHNMYDGEGRRTQLLTAHASPLAYSDVPPVWLEAPIVHLAPVAQELPPPEPGALTRSLLGVTPQGWMRRWGDGGRVLRSAWPVPAALENLPKNAFLVLSVEDVDGDADLAQRYTGLAPLVAITRGGESASMCRDGQCISVPASQADPVDFTGAGDVFAAALFVRYRETGDPVEAARFAHAAAACSIEGQGQAAIPDREAVERKLGVRGEG